MVYNSDNISLLLAQELSKQVSNAWESGEMLEQVTPVTQELLRHWFCEPFTTERTVNFHPGQRQAILNTIYLHEVVGIQTVEDSYAAVMPDQMSIVDMAALAQKKYQMPKYAVKMATGTGKTWVMHALVLWQLLNARHGGNSDRYTQKFLLVAPGIIVYERLLDAYLGKVESGERKVESSDLHKYQDLFLPPQYREEVFGFVQTNTVSKKDIGGKVTGDGMIAITNWHLFLQKEDDSEKDMVDELLPLRPGVSAGNSLDVLDRRYLRGTEMEYLHDLDDLMVINDEAHHVHENGGDEDDVQWQQALDYILENKRCQLQVDFSATPYEQRGSGRKSRRTYFPHIMVDFALKDAMRKGLVKSLMLDQRQELTDLENLDYNAVREGRQVISLSDGQRLMLGAGLTKLRRLEEDFARHDSERRPKMLVVCEDTKVTPFVEEHLIGLGLRAEEVLRIDSDKKGNMAEKDWALVKERLSNVDHHATPRVIVSVMMLREGFDVNNICVVVPLRSATSDILLEQTIGRGLRLMWREPEYAELKLESRQRLAEKREPASYLDMLFIVEHPRFRQFYNDLMEEGLVNIDDGKENVNTVGDLLMATLKEGYKRYDLSWPIVVSEREEVLQPQAIYEQRLQPLTAYTLDQLRRYLAREGEQFVSHSVQVGTTFGKFTVSAQLFTADSYNQYLQKMLHIITHRMGTVNYPLMQVNETMLVGAIDRYIRTRLFAEPFNPMQGNDWKILLAINGVATQHITKEMVAALYAMQQQVEVTDAEVERTMFSQTDKIPVREPYSAEYVKTIYTRTAFPSHGGGLEKAFMDYIDNDGEVERWIKISETRHRFASITYMRTDGLLATYHPDFLVQVAGRIFMVETKGDDKVHDRNVQQKRRAAVEWCEKVSKVQSTPWEYVLISENDFYGLGYAGATFRDMVERCRVNDAIVQGTLSFAE